MYKIYIVEDDYALALNLQNQIKKYGHEVVCSKDFEHIILEFQKTNPQLVLMDIKLPFKDGYYWCNEIRKISSVPIVFLSSASDSMNIVMAMSMGGDDFIEKPVEAMVLNAKINAILRRCYEITKDISCIDYKGVTINLCDGSISKDEKRVDLTKNEMKIMQVLLDNLGKLVSRETLMNHLWQSDMYIEENTLSVNVARLRKKLEEFGLSEFLQTKSGSGYILQ